MKKKLQIRIDESILYVFFHHVKHVFDINDERYVKSDGLSKIELILYLSYDTTTNFIDANISLEHYIDRIISNIDDMDIGHVYYNIESKPEIRTTDVFQMKMYLSSKEDLELVEKYFLKLKLQEI